MVVGNSPTGWLYLLFGILIALVLAGLAWLTPESAFTGSAGGATAVASPLAPVHVGTATAKVFPLPSGNAVVIDAAVNSGALPPPHFEVGYEITITAKGHVTITVTPEGAQGAGAITPTAKQHTISREIGVDGLQRLLNEMDRAGFFGLSPLQGSPRVGGPTSIIDVHLANGAWSVDGAQLPPAALDTLNQIQTLIAAAVGYQPPAS